MGDIDVDFFLETLKQLITSSKVESITKEKHELESLEEKIKIMRQFLKDTKKKRNKHSEVMNLVRQIKGVISEAEDIIEVFVVQAFKANQDHISLDLRSVKKKIKTLTAKVKQIYDGNMYDVNGVADKQPEHSFSKSEVQPYGDGDQEVNGQGNLNFGPVIDGEIIMPPVLERFEPHKDASEAFEVQNVEIDPTNGSNSSGESNASKVAEEKVVVGFNEEVEKLLGNLREGGHLEIISIVGAAGGGKTTLAKEVFDHPLTSHTFEIRAWLNISQDYDRSMKRNLLIRILELAFPKKHGDYEKSSVDKLGEDTCKCLKGKKYLIVMDDIWGIEAWNDIQRSFPDERNGSKVVFTSRQHVVLNGIRCISHDLALLTTSHSWELLQKKVFGKKDCPPELAAIGKDIAKKCKGLPLAIVAIAGILVVEDKTLDSWEKVLKCLISIISKDQDGYYMQILELSYNHLPLHLKACFVYIGGFPEDSEILVRELIWLWVAEGFIQQSGGNKSLEDIAKDYLTSLFDRSLVMVSRKRSFGGIKACYVHDLLRELCLKKAKEDNFLVPIYGDDTISPPPETKHRRLFIGSQFFREYSSRPCTQNLRTFLCLNSQTSAHSPFESNMSFFVENFELLRVLCFISAECRGKERRGHLVHLRYLALQSPNDTSDFVLPFSYLFNLETLNLETLNLQAQTGDLFWKTIPLRRDIFKMVKLRHLYAKRGVFEYHRSCLNPNIAAGIDFDCSSKLDSLQTLHRICPCEECRNFLVRTPNLRKLGFFGDLISNEFVLMLPDLKFLECLETLSFYQRRIPNGATTFPSVLDFPSTVTRLTLENTGLKWEALSILQNLPSLEVLKFSRWACRGHIWDTTELEGVLFPKLKYLRLQDLAIEEWNALEDQFPRLEVIVVRYCEYLKQMPNDFANLKELREIEVRWSSRFAEQSAKEIQEGRKSATGDDDCMNLLATDNIFPLSDDKSDSSLSDDESDLS